MKFWIDAHSHLGSSQFLNHLEDIIFEAEKNNIKYFLQGGIDPLDWQKQISLQRKFGKKIGLCFGLHPYFISSHSEDECEEALDELAQVIVSKDYLVPAIGEMGLDFRPHIVQNSMDRQLNFFSQQLEFAQALSKPVVLHVVQAHMEALRVIDFYGQGLKQSLSQMGLIHAFNGSWTIAQEYIQRGFFISIGGKLMQPGNVKLEQVIREIPVNRLLIETDSPDQGPVGTEYQTINRPLSLLIVAQKIADIKKLALEDLKNQVYENFYTLFQVPTEIN